MFEVRVEADFCAAHFLRDYHGKCENLHGHNYRVYAHARGSALDSGGMLIDFSELKDSLKAVCAGLDHTSLNDIAEFDQNPSAERIAKYIFGMLIERMPWLSKESAEKGTAYLYAVDVFETDTSRARYCID